MLTIQVLDNKLAICRLEEDASLPDWCQNGFFLSITRTPDELSVVCEENLVPEEVRAEKNWCGLKVEGPLDFSLTGILASLVNPLAEAGIPVFALSTFETDYLLVKQERLRETLGILGNFCRITNAPIDYV